MDAVIIQITTFSPKALEKQPQLVINLISTTKIEKLNTTLTITYILKSAEK